MHRSPHQRTARMDFAGASFGFATGLIPVAMGARALLCTPAGADAIRTALRTACPKPGDSFLTRAFKRTASGMFSGGLVPLLCAAGGEAALDALLPTVCALPLPTAQAAQPPDAAPVVPTPAAKSKPVRKARAKAKA